MLISDTVDFLKDYAAGIEKAEPGPRNALAEGIHEEITTLDKPVAITFF